MLLNNIICTRLRSALIYQIGQFIVTHHLKVFECVGSTLI